MWRSGSAVAGAAAYLFALVRGRARWPELLRALLPPYVEDNEAIARLLDVRPVDPGIGHDMARSMARDQHVRRGAHHILRFRQHEFDKAGVLARNFGKDVALSAGLAHATGQAAIPIDCDLQHPPELIPQFVAKWREGWDVVYGTRSRRDGESWLKRTTAAAFYRVMNRLSATDIPADTGDFRLISSRVRDGHWRRVEQRAMARSTRLQTTPRLRGGP